MAMQGTISVIKSDAVAKNVIGGGSGCIEKTGLAVTAKMMCPSQEPASGFFAVYKERSLYNVRAVF